MSELVAWSRGLSTAHKRRNAQALLAIGLGAGLSSQEVSRLAGTDVQEQDGLVLVEVIGEKARTVPVLRTWAASVLEFAKESGDRAFFRPERTRITRADIVAFINRCSDREESLFCIQRTRITWMVTHLAAGTHLAALHRASGVTTAQLTKYLAFEDQKRPQPFPSLVMGMATLHKPSRYPGRQAVRALASVQERGHPAQLLAGDRAYSSAKPEDFQLPARALGYKLVFDYKIDQLGIQGSYAGMLQIEGAWYCPAVPKVLIEATLDYRKGTIDESTYRARLVERWKYLVLSKSGPDAEGHVRLRCPASGPAPVAGAS